MASFVTEIILQGLCFAVNKGMGGKFSQDKVNGESTLHILLV